MKRPFLPEWLRNLFYEWSTHTKINQALHDMKELGIKIGESRIPPPVYKTVLNMQYCQTHGVQLLERELEPGTFDCPLCKQPSGPMYRYQPGSLARAWRDRNPTMKLATSEMEAIRIKNYGGC